MEWPSLDDLPPQVIGVRFQSLGPQPLWQSNGATPKYPDAHLGLLLGRLETGGPIVALGVRNSVRLRSVFPLYWGLGIDADKQELTLASFLQC